MIRSKVSKRYAKALFSLGQEDGNLEQYGSQLSAFASFFRNNAEFGQVIANPIFAVEDRREVLQVVLERSNFFDVVKHL